MYVFNVSSRPYKLTCFAIQYAVRWKSEHAKLKAQLTNCMLSFKTNYKLSDNDWYHGNTIQISYIPVNIYYLYSL